MTTPLRFGLVCLLVCTVSISAKSWDKNKKAEVAGLVKRLLIHLKDENGARYKVAGQNDEVDEEMMKRQGFGTTASFLKRKLPDSSRRMLKKTLKSESQKNLA
ncbi:uncharacterized protein [Argopecten irradians]|uniref:uncharacterized protein n=1 Tax=Argopecten irradians TaxID=31199 RepID=UPI003710FB66